MHDAHTHINDRKMIDYLKEKNIKCIVNACNETEYNFLNLHKYPGMYISCGVHPWYVEATDFYELKVCMEQADFLGEIGLDKPWCKTPFELQKEIFQMQLKMFEKPTILHTKGYEKEVLDIIRLFPRKYLVHWYSCMYDINEYIDLGCFFSVGPSVGIDEAVNEVVRRVPIHRLVLETDGLDAVMWALDKHVDLSQYEEILDNMVKQVANIKKLPFEEVKIILNKNFSALTCN